jgi:hypothetical protein
LRAQARLQGAQEVPLARLPRTEALRLDGVQPRRRPEGQAITLAPLVHPSVHGVEGKPVELGRWCITPGCLALAQQRHHFWPKSFLRGQPYEWVSVNGLTVANSGGVCMRHHNAVTGMVGGHMAHVRWSEKLKLLEWWELDVGMEGGNWYCRGPLKEQGFTTPEPEAARVRRSEQLCPTCGKPKAKHRTSLPKRKSKSWQVTVPDDGEVGADILDTYVENLGTLMGLDAQSPRLLRYHVLVPVLEWVSQDSARFIAEWEES